MPPPSGPKVLVVDDEPQISSICVHFLRRSGIPAESVSVGSEALARIREQDGFSVVFLDIRLPDRNGIDVLREIRRIRPGLEVVMMTAHGTVDDAVESMKLGARDFITKPFKKEKLLASARAALEACRLRAEVDRLQTELRRSYNFEGIVGASKKVRDLYEKIGSAAQHDSTVLILGESGTGKDLVARTIHYNGERAVGPFISVNCAALPGELIESELFGYRKGAFTGATSDSVGLFRAAQGGTIFLDEIVDMPAGTQSKLLRVLQDKKVRPVGGTEEIPVDVRVICATNRDILRALEGNVFRKDLYYRISVIAIEIPALRERREDIPLLVEHFMRRFNERFRKGFRRIEPSALEMLKQYRWEGNVRELENAIESAFAMGRGVSLRKRDFPQHILATAEKSAAVEEGVVPLREAEKNLVKRAMKVSKGNKSRAARLLGVTRKRLYNLIERYGIKK